MKACHFSEAKTRARRSFKQTIVIGIPEFRYGFPEFRFYRSIII